MIIRSQDKKSITNFAQLTDISIHPVNTNNSCYYSVVACYPFAIENDYSNMSLGRYSTEEKAIRVLDMIQEEYGKHYYGEGGQMATANYYVPPFAFIPPKVFQMPQDSEV